MKPGYLYEDEYWFFLALEATVTHITYLYAAKPKGHSTRTGVERVSRREFIAARNFQILCKLDVDSI